MTGTQVAIASFAYVDDGDDRAAALGALVHGVDRHEHRRIADCGGRDAADCGFGMAMVVDIRIIEHDLSSASHFMKQLTTRPPRSSARGRSGRSRPALRIAA